MIHAYDDEDNAPMNEDLPLPYPIRTWEEMIKAWEGGHNADNKRSSSAAGVTATGESADDTEQDQRMV